VKRRFASGENHKRCRKAADRISDFTQGHTITAYKVGIAESAYGSFSIFLATTPQITPSKADKNCRCAAVRALTLNAMENFFDCVSQGLLLFNIGVIKRLAVDGQVPRCYAATSPTT
jgi:hypothetical protein